MTEFLFVRHCQTQSNARPELIGGRDHDTPPTAKGTQQAVQLGTFLRTVDHVQFDAVFSSGAVRTNHTGEVTLAAADLSQQHTIQVDKRLHELSQGDYEGRPRDEIYTPETITQYRLDDLDGHLPTTESIPDGQQRMYEFLIEKHLAFPDGALLVFSHGLAIRALIGKIHNCTKPEILSLSTPNVSLTKIIVMDSTPTVDYVGKNVISG